jgi:signal transduction histidine kinase
MDPETSGHAPGRVLIVDDAADVSSVLAMKLEREGYVVAVAQDTERATRLLDVDDFDVVLLDIRLPDSSGFELLSRLRVRRSPLDTPVIMMSGLDQTSDVIAALQDGANDYLTKPFDLGVAFARIRTQLALKRLKDANDRFLHVAGNDLKKPLMAMLDAAGRLREHCVPGTVVTDDTAHTLATLIESGEFMQQLITELLELRALRERRLRLIKLPTDLGAVVRQAIARASPYAEVKNAELRMEFSRDIPNIRADDARVMQILENLIGNAIKFGPHGNVVTVRTSRDDDWVVCNVVDAGPGLSKSQLTTLFKDYSRFGNETVPSEKSRGLGLAISRELVHLHEGKIGAHNNPDRGATFWFRLPIDGPGDDIEEIVLSSEE